MHTYRTLAVVSAVLFMATLIHVEVAWGETLTPPGTIVGFASGTCPDGWYEYRRATGRFLLGVRAEPDAEFLVGDRGGFATHGHVGETGHARGAGHGTDNDRSDPFVSEPGHAHRVSTDSVDHTPPYVDVTFCILISDTESHAINVPDGSKPVLAYGYPGPCPVDWQDYAPGSGKFLRGVDGISAHAGTTGGTATHGHNGATETAQGANKGADNDNDFTSSQPGHIHGLRIGDGSNMPEFVVVRLCERSSSSFSVPPMNSGADATSSVSEFGPIIAVQSNSCPTDSGWAVFDNGIDHFLRGAVPSTADHHAGGSTVGDTGGVAKHHHKGQTPSAYGPGRRADNNHDFSASKPEHTHRFLTSESENLPPYVNVLFCKLTAT